MRRQLEQRLERMRASGTDRLLGGGRKGLEKESLRIAANGAIALTPHPHAWGAALTHPCITTDYSEALAEFITPAFTDSRDTVRFLDDIHRFAYQHMPDDEVLWAASMPCAVADDSAIPLADYGTSNIGRLKHLYRVGLDYRYGRRMQAIAGVHFNYSLPGEFWPSFQSDEEDRGELQDFINYRYFALIRNFKRFGWMVPLLFGNSPAVCKSFLAGRTTRFHQMQRGTFYLPYATSLRMSDIGYKNKNQSALLVSHDDIKSYVSDLRRALKLPYPEYEAIGTRDGDKIIQLTTSVLQIENEYYSYIRPKRTTLPGERPSDALEKRGVEYVEVRALDVNCMEPTGVSLQQLYFTEVLVLFCLLESSPKLTAEELHEIEYNELTVALRGRTPGLELVRNGGRVGLREWSLEICARMQPLAAHLDAHAGATFYQDAVARQIEALNDMTLLPSARVLAALHESQSEFHSYTRELSLRHRADFRARPPSAEVTREFDSLAAASLAEQARLEADRSEPFAEFMDKYLQH
jgi:glutamate--cysteine ligase